MWWILAAFDLPVLEVNEGISSENADRNAQLAAIGIDLFNYPALVLERTIGHLNGLADAEADLGFYCVLTLADLREQAVYFRRTHRDWAIFGARKPDNARRVLDEVPSPIDELIVVV